MSSTVRRPPEPSSARAGATRSVAAVATVTVTAITSERGIDFLQRTRTPADLPRLHDAPTSAA
jgi:hypothetical protein